MAGELVLDDLFYELANVRGMSLDDFAFVATGGDQMGTFIPYEDVCWIGVVEREQVRLLRGGFGWLRGMWRSEGGTIYVAGALGPDIDRMTERGLLRGRRDAQGGYSWDVPHSAFNLAGVWGLHEEYMFSWGFGGGVNEMWLFTGRDWEPIDCPGEVVAMHGIAPDLIFAVGHRGLVAMWDGSSWTRMSVEAQGTVSSVHVESADRVFATASGHLLLEGSKWGWGTRLVARGHLDSVTSFHGDIWVSSPDLGLCRVENDQLVEEFPKIHGLGLQADDHSMLSFEQWVVTRVLPDGDFRTWSTRHLDDAIRDGRVPWQP